MKILLVGSGGREHALAWKLAQSKRVSEVVAAPGNAGMIGVASIVPVELDNRELLALIQREAPDLVVIGPEAPLVAGLADELEAQGVAVFGPGQAGARLEGSKAYAKEFMRRHGIPTASYRAFNDRGAALHHLQERGAPVVIKDSALAAGKGVTVANELAVAEAAVERIFAGRSPGGDTGASSGTVAQVVIEECLIGQEFSYLVFTDGHTYRTMPIAQDYKQAEDGDRGAMTGGMGAVAPVDLLDEETRTTVEREVVERTLDGLRSDGIDFRGVLYFGLMLTSEGPKLLEYNVRLGDPETQVVLPLLASDLVDVIESVVERRLAGVSLRWHDASAACVVLTAPGYPGEYRKGVPVTAFEPEHDLLVFHAGTSLLDGRVVSSGGRVLNVVALAENVQEAVRSAYRGVARVDFPGTHFRTDIGARLLR
ncbi:MAG: phosphoribosylamine--glycine ligase [Trueperaceae bacterium]